MAADAPNRDPKAGTAAEARETGTGGDAGRSEKAKLTPFIENLLRS
jgi:hypothetical protein